VNRYFNRGSVLLELVRDKIAALDLPSYVKDSELRYVAVNSAFARLHNLAPQSFIGCTDREILGPDSDSLRDEASGAFWSLGKSKNSASGQRPTAHRTCCASSGFSTMTTGSIFSASSNDARLLQKRVVVMA